MSCTDKNGDNLLEDTNELLFTGFAIIGYRESEDRESTYYAIALPQW